MQNQEIQAKHINQELDTVEVIKSHDDGAERILDGDDAEKATGLEAAKQR